MKKDNRNKIAEISLKKVEAGKKVTELFKGKGLIRKKRSFSFNEFDNIVRKVAEVIDDREQFKISFYVKWEDSDNSINEDLFNDVSVTKLDCEMGLIGLIDKDIIDSSRANMPTDQAEEVRDQINHELNAQNIDDDEFDEEDLVGDIPEQTRTQPSLSSSLKGNEDPNSETFESEKINDINETIDLPSKYSDLEADSEEVNITNEEEPVQPTDEEDAKPFSLQESFTPTVDEEVQPSDMQTIFSSFKEPESLTESSETDADSNPKHKRVGAMPRIESINKYANPGQFDMVVEDIDLKSFNLDELKVRLGYVDSPEDKYQEELNKFIDEKINSFGLGEFLNNYNLTIRRIVDDKIKLLSDQYRKVNEQSVFVEAEDRASTPILELNNKTEEQISANNDSFMQRFEEKQASLKKSVDERVELYRKQLEVDASTELDNYQTALKNDIADTNKRLLTQSDQEAENIKNDIVNAITEERNQALLEEKQDVVSDFNKQINLEYMSQSDDFYETSKKCLGLVNAKKTELQNQKREDERIQEEKAKEERILAQKDRELDIQEAQAKQDPKLMAQQVYSQIAPLLANSMSPQSVPAVNYQANPDVSALKEQLTNIQRELSEQKHKNEMDEMSRKVEAANKANQKSVSKLKRAFFISGAVLLMTTCGLGSYFLNQHQSAAQASTVPTIIVKASTEKTKKKTTNSYTEKKPKQSQKSSRNKVSSTQPNVTSQVETEKTKEEPEESITDKFLNAKNNADRYDILNALLGQDDFRNLNSINSILPTPIGNLYEAILHKDGNKIRNRYLGLTNEDRGYLSGTAKDAITLAFYDIAEWQQGTEVRNAE